MIHVDNDTNEEEEENIVNHVFALSDDYTPADLNRDLIILNNLGIIHYKITAANEFRIEFREQFLDWAHKNSEKLKRDTKENLLYAIKTMPFTEITLDNTLRMYYITVVFDYVIETNQIGSVNFKDSKLMRSISNKLRELDRILTNSLFEFSIIEQEQEEDNSNHNNDPDLGHITHN